MSAAGEDTAPKPAGEGVTAPASQHRHRLPHPARAPSTKRRRRWARRGCLHCAFIPCAVTGGHEIQTVFADRRVRMARCTPDTRTRQILRPGRHFCLVARGNAVASGGGKRHGSGAGRSEQGAGWAHGAADPLTRPGGTTMPEAPSPPPLSFCLDTTSQRLGGRSGWGSCARLLLPCDTAEPDSTAL